LPELWQRTQVTVFFRGHSVESLNQRSYEQMMQHVYMYMYLHTRLFTIDMQAAYRASMPDSPASKHRTVCRIQSACR